MFELKYKITESDVKAVNSSVARMYFIMYLVVSLGGIAAGVAATVLRPRTEILILGVLLLVLGAILLVCSVLLIVAPKNFVASALLPSEELERDVRIDEDRITVCTEGHSDIIIGYGEITKLKNKGSLIVANIGREQLLLIKDAICSGQTMNELFEFLSSRTKREKVNKSENKIEAGKATAPAAPAPETSDKTAAEEAENLDEYVASESEKPEAGKAESDNEKSE